MEEIMLWTVFIIALMAGCGDVSVPAAPGKPSVPSDREAPTEPDVFEIECGEAEQTEEAIYFFAEAVAPEWEFVASTCVDTDDPTARPACTATTAFVVEDGILRVLCGAWNAAAMGPLADFVRIEPASAR
jgi:hypothetical protein